jgi:regulator of replication initiation timing
MSANNVKNVSREKLHEVVALLTADDPSVSDPPGQIHQNEAVTASLLLGIAANSLAGESSLKSVTELRGKDLVLFLRKLIEVSQATLLACDGIQSVLPSVVPETLIAQLQETIEGLKKKIGGAQAEISEIDASISEVVEDNKSMEEQLQQRIKEVDILFENNTHLKSLLDVYANVNIYVARSLPGRFHSLTTKLNRIEQDLHDVDAGLRKAIEEHQETKLLCSREA